MSEKARELQKHYSKSFKQEVVRAYLAGEGSYTFDLVKHKQVKCKLPIDLSATVI